MTNDKRKKGCPNEGCEMHKKKAMQKSDVDYCPKCGMKMIYVCSKCFKEIEDTDKKHRICYLCEADLEEKHAQQIEKVKEGTEKTVKLGVALAAPVLVGIYNKVIKDGQKDVIKKGADAVEKVMKTVLKK